MKRILLVLGFWLLGGRSVVAFDPVYVSQPCATGAICEWSEADSGVRICKDGYVDRSWSMYAGHSCNVQQRVVNASGVDVSYMYGPGLTAPTVLAGNGYSCSTGVLAWSRPANAGAAPLGYVVTVNDRSTNVDYVPTATAPNYDPKDKWIVISSQQLGTGSTALNLTAGISYNIGIWPFYIGEPYEKWSRHITYTIGPQIMCAVATPTIPSTALSAPTGINYNCSNTTLTWTRPTNAGSNALGYALMINDHRISNDYLPGTGVGKDANDQWIVVNDQTTAANLSKAVTLIAGDSIDIAVEPFYIGENYAQWSRHSMGRIGPQVMCAAVVSPSPTTPAIRCVSSAISRSSLDMSDPNNTFTVTATYDNPQNDWNKLAMYNVGNTFPGGNAKDALLPAVGNVKIGNSGANASYQENAVVTAVSATRKTFTWSVRAGDIDTVDQATGGKVNNMQLNAYAGGWPIENMESCVQKIALVRPPRCVGSSISLSSLSMSDLGNTVTFAATIANAANSNGSVAFYNMDNLFSVNNPKPARLPSLGNVHIGASATDPSYQNNPIISANGTTKTFTWSVRAGDIDTVDQATGGKVNKFRFIAYAGGNYQNDMANCVQDLNMARPPTIPSTALSAPTGINYNCSNTTLTWTRPTNAGSNALGYALMINDHRISNDYLPGTGVGKDANDQWIVVNDQTTAANLSKAVTLIAGDSIDIAVEPFYIGENYAQWSRHSMGRIGPQVMCASPVRCSSSNISTAYLDMSNIGNTVTVTAVMENAKNSWNSLAMYNVGNTDANGNAKPAILLGGNVHIGETAGQPSYQNNATVSISGSTRTFVWSVKAGDVGGMDAATGRMVNDLQLNAYAGGWPIENMESCVQKIHLSRSTDPAYSCPGSPVACSCTGSGCKNEGGANTDWRCCHRACVNNACRTVAGPGVSTCATEGATCNRLVGDYNNNGTVDIGDFTTWKVRYGALSMTISDFMVWKNAYLGLNPTATIAAP